MLKEIEFMQSQYETFINASEYKKKKYIREFKQKVFELVTEINNNYDVLVLMGNTDSLIDEDTEKDIPKGIKLDLGDGLIYCYDLERKELVLIGLREDLGCAKMPILFSLADRVANSAFMLVHTITSINLPCCKKIGDNAFTFTLVSYAICPRLRIIGDSSFNCSYLISIEAENVREIAIGAFSSCHYLKSVYFPKVKKIRRNTFSFCDNLEDVTLSSGARVYIESFRGCKALKKIKGGNIYIEYTLGGIEKLENISVLI